MFGGADRGRRAAVHTARDRARGCRARRARAGGVRPLGTGHLTWTWPTALVLVGLLGLPAQAAQHRFALAIGSNLGMPDEQALLYAERDATRVADVLVRFADVSEENLLLLRGANAETVERVFGELKRRVALTRKHDRHASVLLTVYYSGHASVGALHLGPSQLSFKRLRALAADTQADVSVFVLDACRSGGLTRVKGATPDKPFEIKVEDQLDSSGTAIITSSAQGEDAQESDRLEGGIFTHHLLGGLLGAADTSRDGRVTLAEAYKYAYDQTLRTTSRTRFVQHPTYAFRIKGKQDLTLTRLDRGAGMGRLHLIAAGDYVIMDQTRGGSVVAEVVAAADTDVLLPRGRYLVRRRDDRGVQELAVAIVEGKRAQLAVEQMQRRPYGQTVRRGMRERSAVSLGVEVAAAQAMLDGLSSGLFGALTAQVDLSDASIQFRLRYGQAGSDNVDVTMQQDMLGLDVGALRIFDVRSLDLGFGLGVRGGADWVKQAFRTRGAAPERDQLVWRVGPVARAEYALASWSNLALDCGLDVHALRIKQGDSSPYSAAVAPFCGLGWSFYLP